MMRGDGEVDVNSGGCWKVGVETQVVAVALTTDTFQL